MLIIDYYCNQVQNLSIKLISSQIYVWSEYLKNVFTVMEAWHIMFQRLQK